MMAMIMQKYTFTNSTVIAVSFYHLFIWLLLYTYFNYHYDGVYDLTTQEYTCSNSTIIMIIIIDRFYIALFSALEQTHCACMRFDLHECRLSFICLALALQILYHCRVLFIIYLFGSCCINTLIIIMMMMKMMMMIMQEYTFTNSTAVAVQHEQPPWTGGVMEKVKVASIPLPSVGAGITWRRMVIGLRTVGECQTSHTFRHCSLLAIRFFVQVRVWAVLAWTPGEGVGSASLDTR